MEFPRRSTLLALLFTVTYAPLVAAQDPVLDPVPPKPMTVFVVDLRGAMAALKQEASVAADLAVPAEELPSRGLGFVIGAHVYPVRRKSFALGVGAELLRVRGSNTIEALLEDGVDGPTIRARWNHVSPQVSLNFGARDGWSYLTVGLGRSTFTNDLEEAPQEDGDAVGTLNYGGGARWFMKKHLAFTFDIRFYSVNAQEAVDGRIATPKMRLRVLSAGISLR
jgi:hypothetical protein